MRYLKTLALCALGAVAALFFMQALALADVNSTSTVNAPPVTLPSGWAGLVMLALVFASWGLRKFSTVPFFHTTAGAAVMGILSSAIPALIDVIKSGNLTVPVAETAVFGALLSFFASDNASNTAEEQQRKVLAMRVARAPQPPPPVRPGSLGALLPLALVFGLASGCQTAGGQALAKCELGALPSAAGTVIAQLVAIAFSGGNYQQQLESAGESALASNAAPQFNCAVEAVSGWLQQTAPKGEISPSRREATEAFKAYRAAHPASACRAAPVL